MTEIYLTVVFCHLSLEAFYTYCQVPVYLLTYHVYHVYYITYIMYIKYITTEKYLTDAFLHLLLEAFYTYCQFIYSHKNKFS